MLPHCSSFLMGWWRWPSRWRCCRPCRGQRCWRPGGGSAATLGQGLRLVLVLIVPATLGLLVLARPAVALLFQHGQFTAYDTLQVSSALRYYLLGLIFASIDWPLNYAFMPGKHLDPGAGGRAQCGSLPRRGADSERPDGMLGLVLADAPSTLASHDDADPHPAAYGSADRPEARSYDRQGLPGRRVMAGAMAWRCILYRNG